VSKQTSRSEGKTEVREKAESDKTDVSAGDRHEKQGSRQRLRYKVGGLVSSLVFYSYIMLCGHCIDQLPDLFIKYFVGASEFLICCL